jgi:endonuclease/exonuclease/phosphatase family metal-dependent hydrolase
MIRVMSFNIRYGIANDGEHHWEHRKNGVIKRIRAFSPDLLGLQECRDDHQATYIKSQLPEYEFIGFPRGGSRETGLEMTPVLFKENLYTSLEHGNFWISLTPEVPASKLRDSFFPRTVTWTLLENKNDSSQRLVFANTHLDYAPGAPYQSARILKEQLSQISLDFPLILAGDFNTQRGSPAYGVLTESSPGQTPNLFDTVTAATQNAPSGTFHDYGRIPDPPAIDWILASPHFRTLAAGVDQSQVRGLYPSDHYPVVAVLSL